MAVKVFVAMLQVLFIGLKLTNYIDWSWWLVLLPLIVSLGVVTFVILIALALVGMGLQTPSWRKR